VVACTTDVVLAASVPAPFAEQQTDTTNVFVPTTP